MSWLPHPAKASPRSPSSVTPCCRPAHLQRRGGDGQSRLTEPQATGLPFFCTTPHEQQGARKPKTPTCKSQGLQVLAATSRGKSTQSFVCHTLLHICTIVKNESEEGKGARQRRTGDSHRSQKTPKDEKPLTPKGQFSQVITAPGRGKRMQPFVRYPILQTFRVFFGGRGEEDKQQGQTRKDRGERYPKESATLAFRRTQQRRAHISLCRSLLPPDLQFFCCKKAEI